MNIRTWRAGRRSRILAAVGWTAGMIVLVWAVLANDEIVRARAVFRSLAHDGAGAGAPGLAPAQRLDRLGEGIRQARSAVQDVRGHTGPVRVTGGAWGWVPFRGGDVSRLDSILDYADALLDGADAVVAWADAVVSASGGELTTGRLPEVATALRGERQTLDEAAALLADAGRLYAEIDVAALSGATGDLIRATEDLRRDALLAADLAALAPPLLDAAGAVASVGQEAPSFTPTGEYVDLDGVRWALASLEQRWPDIVSAAERLGPKVGADGAEMVRAAAYAGDAVAALSGLALAALDAESILAAGLPGTPEAAGALGVSLSEIQVQASLAYGALGAAGDGGPFSGLFGLAAGRLKTAQALAEFLHRFLGYERPTVHVFLGQDDEELRPSGGFLAAVWEVRFDHGRLSWQSFKDAYRVDRLIPAGQWPVAPSSFSLGLGASGIPFRDQNWWADFPRSAGVIRTTYELSERVKPDSLVAFNQATLEGLLEVTGPLDLLGRSATRDEVDAATVRAFLREGEPPPEYASVWDESRYASYVVGRAIIDFLTRGEDIGPQRLAAAALGFLRAGDLLVSAGTPELDAVFNALDWDGGLPRLDNDGFYWVEANAHSSKISHLLRRSLEHRVHLASDGSATGEITVRYENTASPASPYCVQPSLPPHPPCHWLLFRLYLPGGAEIVEVPILPLPEGAMAATALAPGTDTVAVARGADGEPAEVIEVSGLGTTPAGGASEWRFRYSLPGAARPVGSERWRYTWDATRQPGMRGAAYHLDIELPEGACLVDNGAHSGSRSLDLPDQRRMMVTVDYSMDPLVCGDE